MKVVARKYFTLYITNRMEAGHKSQSDARRRVSTGALSGLSVALALIAGLGLRLWMLKEFFQANGDSLIYGGLAKNLLLHGSYALNGAGNELYPTLIRLPGYPLFLALCFRVFGMENYASAAWVQIALELAGCLLVADFAGRIAPDNLRRGAAHGTLWLALLCPFTAIYAAEPMAEALTLFMLALALWSAERFRARPGWALALAFTFAVTYAALLRPDGALVAVALVPALVMGLKRGEKKLEIPGEVGDRPGAPSLRRSCFCRKGGKAQVPEAPRPGAPSLRRSCFCRKGGKAQILEAPRPGAPFLRRSCFCRKGGNPQILEAPRLVRMAVVCALLALMPFAAWSWRNWRVFHVFEPLAPRLATDPGEDLHLGWERWVKSWCLDFASTYEIYWSVPGDALEMSKLPSRAFDSPAQHAETAALAADYNASLDITPALDARFGKLAGERIAVHPLRSALWLPLGRMADMWLRPRIENLPIDLDWWNYERHHAETRFSWAYAGLNAVYLLLGIAGLCLRPRFGRPMLAYFVLRSALLMTIEAPEARYTLECFPMLFALGGVAACAIWEKVRKSYAGCYNKR